MNKYNFPDRSLSREEAEKMVGLSRTLFNSFCQRYNVPAIAKNESSTKKQYNYMLYDIQDALSMRRDEYKVQLKEK